MRGFPCVHCYLKKETKWSVGGTSVVPSKSPRIPAFFHDHYKEPIDGKYQDTTVADLAGLGSELEADVELSGCSSESEAKRKCSLQRKSQVQNKAWTKTQMRQTKYVRQRKHRQLRRREH